MFLRIFSFLLLVSLPLQAKGPHNDFFARAVLIKDSLPLVIKGSFSDRLDRFRATKEDDEPDHAGQRGSGSVWYKWAPEVDVRVSVEAGSEGMNMILAAYTGRLLSNLTLVHRYPDFAFPAFSRMSNEPFSKNARIEFDAKAGTKYYFAVDAESHLFQPFTLRMELSKNTLNPEMKVFSAGGRWEYLLARSVEGKPVDPEVMDPDFYQTWMNPDIYNGPKFKKGNAPFGYGELDFGRIRTNIFGKRGTAPPINARHAAYFRTTFTPQLDVKALGIEGIFDDGAIIYINGVERAKVNIGPKKNSNDWLTRADLPIIADGWSTELHIHHVRIEGLDLPADKPVEIAMSLHNVKLTSSDLGFDMRIFSLAPKPAQALILSPDQ